MSQAELKSKIHQVIDEVTDNQILEAVFEALHSSDLSTIHSVSGKPLAKDEIDGMLEEGENDIRSGETVSQDQIKEDIKSWRQK